MDDDEQVPVDRKTVGNGMPQQIKVTHQCVWHPPIVRGTLCFEQMVSDADIYTVTLASQPCWTQSLRPLIQPCGFEFPGKVISEGPGGSLCMAMNEWIIDRGKSSREQLIEYTKLFMTRRNLFERYGSLVDERER